MSRGYMEKTLFVNLSTGELRYETFDENIYRDFIGGYGIGARILYSCQKPGVDPLGPENTLGFLTGPLTGTPALMGCRYTTVGKSPLTGGWGDANCGGHFGPHLKFAGYDSIFFTGISEKPVYLSINNGKAELRDAGHLWGKSAPETEDELKAELGANAEVISIGPAGEKKARIACIITRRGLSASGRSGLGAVMGSKKLKSVVVKGDQEVPVADIDEANRLREEHLAAFRAVKMGEVSFYDEFHKYGTAGHANIAAHSGDTPVRNWGGVGVIDLPDVSGLTGTAVLANQDKQQTCWHCPLACQAIMKAGTGEYKYPAGTARPEYETLASFGAMCLCSNTDAVIMANHICNTAGLDTISAGTTVAFAMECYEHGLITKEDTDGIELNWGNHQAMIAVLEKMARREGIGDVLADGTKAAAEKIGKGAEEYAINIGGQELGYHDPKLASPFPGPSAARYWLDPTPGRHSQGFGPTGLEGHLRNSAGICLTGYGGLSQYIYAYINAVTGWKRSKKELLQAGERILNMRHAFNLREGINPLKWRVPPRVYGDPPQKEGPLAGVSANIIEQSYWNLGALGWDMATTKPSKEKLLELGLDNVAQELWP